MHRRFRQWKSPLVVTLILVALIAAASYFVTRRINTMEENASFNSLAKEAEEFAHSIELNVSSDRDKLELIASLMAVSLNEPEDFLRLYRSTGTFFSRLELLLPGDQVVTGSGEIIDASGALSFEREAALGAHISDRETDIDGEGYAVRHFVPVKQEDEVVAMLYGVIELGRLGEELPYSPYGGEAAVYVIDGATGDFLIDTWHREIGKIWQLGARPMVDGYDDAQLRQGLVDGQSNYVVFISNTTGERLYFYYAPLAINQWRVALSVPEDTVFASARNIRGLLNILLVIESALFAAYIVWMTLYVRRETGEKQRQLDALSYIYDVEKLLFNAHEHRENVTDSLEVIGRMLPARHVAFTMFEEDGSTLDYLWEDGDEFEIGSALLQGARILANFFAAGYTELYETAQSDVRAILYNAPEKMGDIVAIPVEDSGGVIRGVLSASGLKKRAGCVRMLKSVAFSFALFYSNTHTYRRMQRQGERDALTGAYNRNRYERDLSNIAAECTGGLCCVFIDANGLHEMNNTFGHEAGDEMLRTVADGIRDRFGGDHLYRLGGDEFVVFVPDGSEPEVAHHCRAVTEILAQKGYHISAGVSWRKTPVEDVEALVREAERHMYEVKREYYSSPGRDRRARATLRGLETR